LAYINDNIDTDDN